MQKVSVTFLEDEYAKLHLFAAADKLTTDQLITKIVKDFLAENWKSKFGYNKPN